jgi:short-subunit dehydrogenase
MLLSAFCAQVRTYAADLTQRSSLDALLQHLSDSNTQISVLVANAGGAVTRFTSYWDFSESEEATMQALNGTACYVLVRQLLPGMVQVGSRLCISGSDCFCLGFDLPGYCVQGPPVRPAVV